jgi:hypothetical protein
MDQDILDRGVSESEKFNGTDDSNQSKMKKNRFLDVEPIQ